MSSTSAHVAAIREAMAAAVSASPVDASLDLSCDSVYCDVTTVGLMPSYLALTMVNSVVRDHLELDSLPRSSRTSISHDEYLSRALLLEPPPSKVSLMLENMAIAEVKTVLSPRSEAAMATAAALWVFPVPTGPWMKSPLGPDPGRASA